MKMNRFTAKISGLVLALSFLFVISACSDIDSGEAPGNGTYLVLAPNGVSFDARSVEPDANYMMANFTDITLTATKSGGTKQTLASSIGNLESLYAKQFLLEGGAGTYSFELKGSLDSVYFYQKLEEETIEESKTNAISFSLSPIKSSSDTSDFEDKGGLSVDLKFSKTNVKSIYVTLLNLDTNEIKEERTISSSYFTSSGYTYKKNASYPNYYTELYTEGSIDPGTYRLTFDFLTDNKLLINSFSYIVHVVKGLNSIVTQEIDLNQVYSISYTKNGGSLAEGVEIAKYTRLNEVILPRLARDNYAFIGWYDNSSFEGEPVTKIEKGSTGNKSFYARFVSSALYVNAAKGDDSHDGSSGSSTNALQTLGAALNKMALTADGKKLDYTIYLTGTFTGEQTIADISATETLPASSITLAGYSGVDSVTGEPKDVLDGGFTESSKGSTLTISTTVPVIIKNLKITGGNNSGTGSVQGGGLYVADGAKVTLEEDVLITKNAAANGGGIYNEGTVIVSDAVISENTASGSGSGVYNNGTFKIGSGADIGSENDVYLPKEKTVTILEEGTMGSVKIMLTPSEYAAGTQIVVGENVTDLATEIKDALFVTPQTKDDSGATLDAPVEWILDEDGKLQLPEETDFVLVAGGTIGKSENVGMEDNNANGNDLIIPDLLVGSHLVTQEEYEQLMTYYGVVHEVESLVPSADDDKAKAPAYFVSWIDAIIYCNLLSESEGLTPVYSMSGQNEITAASTDDNPNPWTKYYHVAEYDGKYCYDSNDLSDASSYDWDSEVYRYDFSADGYRLPTSAEYRYLLQNNPDVIGETGYNEWCNNYFPDYKRVWFDGENGDVAEGNDSKESITRESNLGFRVVRNATE